MDTKRLGMTSPTNIWLARSTILCTDDFCEPLTSAQQPRKSKALPLADNCHQFACMMELKKNNNSSSTTAEKIIIKRYK
ncbi:hypothetical protein T03_10257 [Trichinella britovi]|uniref:Uncharacterized protein n=2 Tax=Trichinella TaxID=6333 RepID=A0A0V1CGB1_TRIBR|nr:hypothetical protein T05_7763 [Trichinella murrelli]KRY48301.1 hypothetical protein T03_10257 [Trichinella britovi]